jgi:hypothetical protein
MEKCEGVLRLTGVVQVFSKLHISVSASSDVEISLYFVALQTSEDAATVRLPAYPGSLAELPLPRLAQLLMYVPQLFPTRDLLIIPLVQLMCSPLQVLASPLCQGAVAGSVLHVDVEVGAAHGYNDVEVYLHVVGDAFLDGELLGGGAGVPARYLGPREVDACENEGDRPGGGVAALYEVCLLGLGCIVMLV